MGIDLKKKIVHGDMSFCYSFSGITKAASEWMLEQAEKADLASRYAEMASGKRMNASENRMVLHQLFRAKGTPCETVRANCEFYRGELGKVFRFAKDVLSGKVLSSAGKTYTNFVQIGIGGSIMGARMLFKALLSCREKVNGELNGEFLSNPDEGFLDSKLAAFDFSRTFFAFVSKSGTTSETLYIKKYIDDYIERKTGARPTGEDYAFITDKGSPMSKSDECKYKFFIDENIGGRFSVSSPCGVLIPAIVFGEDAVREFLDGMNDVDVLSAGDKPFGNPAMLSALYSYYEHVRMKKNVSVVIPYAEGLAHLTEYLQQLLMESNCKCTDAAGNPIKFSGQYVFGDRGTCAQHSFFQALHQGVFPYSLEFIGFADKKFLLKSLVSQCVALYEGDKEHNFPGKRYSTVLMFGEFSPFALGQLISFYENKTAFLGFLYGINSFDQPGVELGKRIFKKIGASADKKGPDASYLKILKAFESGK